MYFTVCSFIAISKPPCFGEFAWRVEEGDGDVGWDSQMQNVNKNLHKYRYIVLEYDLLQGVTEPCPANCSQIEPCPNAHLFWFTPPISPLFKRPESRREGEPALPTCFKVLLVLFVFIGVS